MQNKRQIGVRLRCIELPGRRFGTKQNIKVDAQQGDMVVDDVFAVVAPMIGLLSTY